MPTIKISELRPTGSDLFSDSEGYMNDLDESEFEGIYGGLTPALVLSAVRVSILAGRSSQGCAMGAAGAVGAVGRLTNRD